LGQKIDLKVPLRAFNFKKNEIEAFYSDIIKAMKGNSLLNYIFMVSVAMNLLINDSWAMNSGLDPGKFDRYSKSFDQFKSIEQIKYELQNNYEKAQEDSTIRTQIRETANENERLRLLNEEERKREKEQQEKERREKEQEDTKNALSAINEMITKIKDGIEQDGCNRFREENESKYNASPALNDAIEMATCYLEQNKDKFEKQEYFIVNDLTATPGSEGRLLLVHASGKIMKEIKSFDGRGGPGGDRDAPGSNKTPGGYLCTGVKESTDAVANGVRIKGLQEKNDKSDGRGIKLHASRGPTHGCIGMDMPEQEIDEFLNTVKLENPDSKDCGTLILNYSEEEAQGKNNACEAPVN
jgi:uncharacterized protein YukE